MAFLAMNSVYEAGDRLTSEEASLWQARLTRIWLCEQNHRPLRTYLRNEGRQFSFYVDYSDHVEMEVEFGYKYPRSVWTVTLALCDDQDRNHLSQVLQFDGYNGELTVESHCTPPDPEFIARWLNKFRRNCWLTGFPIEASATEKAEWLQGFTREEVQSWNLHF